MPIDLERLRGANDAGRRTFGWLSVLEDAATAILDAPIEEREEECGTCEMLAVPSCRTITRRGVWVEVE